jgi:hypothetical protein
VSELLPCPFCGAGETQIEENGRIWAGTKYSDPISVSVRHWCEPVEGQPSRMIERIGRDRESAIAAWNRRPSPATPAEDARDGDLVALHLLEEVCAFYANDEDRFLKDDGEPYGSIPTEVGMVARAARARFNARERAAIATQGEK